MKILNVYTVFLVFSFLSWNLGGLNETQAQPLLSAVEMGLGGSGSTNVSGALSNFYNPANLMLKTDRNRFKFFALSTAGYYNGVVEQDSFDSQVSDFKNHFQKFENPSMVRTTVPLADLIDRNFKDGDTQSENSARFDVVWLGFSIRNETKSYSLAIRTRSGNRFETGINWYQTNPVERSDGEQIFNRSLRQQFQVLHEISFGYAERIGLIENSSSRLDQFSFGIAPKIVFPGAYTDNFISSVSRRPSNSGDFVQISHYSQASSGAFGNHALDVQNNIGIRNSIDRRFDGTWLTDISGIGAGIDLGMTYLLTFGEDFSSLPGNTDPVKNSLRISFSITDIGIIRYDSNTFRANIPQDTTLVSSLSAPSEMIFRGAPGEFFAFLEANNTLNSAQPSSFDEGSFTQTLPTAFHAGFMFQWARAKVLADFNWALASTAFHSKRLFTHLGGELSLLPFLPVRGGIRFAEDAPTIFSIGSSLVFKHIELSAAAQFSSNQVLNDSNISGLGLLGVTYKF